MDERRARMEERRLKDPRRNGDPNVRLDQYDVMGNLRAAQAQ